MSKMSISSPLLFFCSSTYFQALQTFSQFFFSGRNDVVFSHKTLHKYLCTFEAIMNSRPIKDLSEFLSGKVNCMQEFLCPFSLLIVSEIFSMVFSRLVSGLESGVLSRRGWCPC